MFAPINFGMKKEEAEQKALEIAKLLGISHLLKKSPFNLSGGQMRKVSLWVQLVLFLGLKII